MLASDGRRGSDLKYLSQQVNERNLLFVNTESTDRLDRWLASQLADQSRSSVQRWIEAGLVWVNERPARASLRLSPGDRVAVALPEIESSALVPEAIPLDIVYEDSDLLVVDKPAGMVVHPSPGHASGTLVNAIIHHCPDLEGVGGVRRPGIVHRLDKDTSGLLLVAKNDRAHRHLQAQFKARTVEKTYLALVVGRLEQAQGRIDAPIGRHPQHRQRMAVLPLGQGREAVTDYEVVTVYAGATLVAAHPRTGRTHQIHVVHFASLGHPIVGDLTYGPRRDRFALQRHFLHAHRLRFQRPGDEVVLDLSSPLPADLQAALERLAL